MATGITTIGTMNITQIKSSLFPLWWKAWIAILLLAFGLPSLVARIVMLPGDHARTSLLAGETLDGPDLERVYLSRRKAAAWFPENALYNDLALASLELSGRVQGDHVKAFLQESALWQNKALNVSPADAFGWYRLAYLLYMAEGPSQRVAKAWEQSLSSAPYEPRLVVPRLQMALGLGPAFLASDAALFHVPRLIRSLAVEDPDLLAKLAREGNFVSVVEEALRNEPESLSAFHERLGGDNR